MRMRPALRLLRATWSRCDRHPVGPAKAGRSHGTGAGGPTPQGSDATLSARKPSKRRRARLPSNGSAFARAAVCRASDGYGPAGTGYYVPWTANTTDAAQTFGLTTDRQVIPHALKISFDHTSSYGDNAGALGDGMARIGGSIARPSTIAALTFRPQPDVTSMPTMIRIRGDYTFRPDLTVTCGDAFEKSNDKDFMYTAGATQYANALRPGTSSPNAAIHVSVPACASGSDPGAGPPSDDWPRSGARRRSFRMGLSRGRGVVS